MADKIALLTDETVYTGDPGSNFLDPLEIPEYGEEAQTINYDEDSLNLVPDFEAAGRIGEDALKKIADTIWTQYSIEWDAQEEYREQWARDLEMFALKLRPKQAPFQDCANIGIPMAMENLSRLVMKAYVELFGDWSKILSFGPYGHLDDDDAEKIALHVTYQLREECLDFPRQQQRGIMMFFMGRVACHSYWDESRGCIRHEMLSPEELLIPYQRITTMPDLSDSPWIIRRRFYARHELESMRSTFSNVDIVLKARPSWGDEGMESPTREMLDEMNKVEPTEGGAEAPFLVLQYEGWMSLPGQDRQRYIQVFMDANTKKLMRLVIHEEPSWDDKLRYERQRVELSYYRQAYTERQTARMMSDAASLAGGMPPEQPQEDFLVPPMWMKNPDDLSEEPEPMKKKPIHLFSHTVCIESLAGSEGIGYGRPQAELNMAANTLMSQFVDAATLSNMPTYIAGADTTFEDNDSFRISPGRINKLSNSSSVDVRAALVKVDIPPANGQMIQLIKMLWDWAQSSAQSPDILSGGEVKSGEPYRSTAARMEQASQQLSSITQKYSLFLKQIIRNHCRLNSYFLPDEVTFSVPSYQNGEPITVTRQMYQAQRPVLLTSDMRYASAAQRVQEADDLMKMSMSVPWLMARPRFQYEAFKQSLMARGRHDMIPLLGTPPPVEMPQQGAPGAVPQPLGKSQPSNTGERNAAIPATAGGRETLPAMGGARQSSAEELTK